MRKKLVIYFIFWLIPQCVIAQEVASELANIKQLIDKQQYDSVALLLDRSIQVFTDNGNQQALAETYFLYSQYYLRGSKFEQRLNSPKAYEMSKKAFDLYEATNDQKGAAKAKLNYGLMLNRMGEFYKARNAYLESLATFTSISDSLGICQALTRLGQIYGWEDRPFYSLDSSVYYMTSAIEVAKSMGGERLLAKTYIYAASPIIRKGYKEQKYLHLGLEITVAAQTYYHSDTNSYNYIIAKLNKGFALEALGKGDQAITIANELLAADVDVWTKSECYRMIYKVHKRNGRFREALETHELYKLHEDTMERADTRRSIYKMESAFMRLAKDKEISDLEQDRKIQALELQQQRFLLFGLGTGLVLLALGGFLYYRNYKYQKERAESELKQRFLRSQLNPHFIFNAIGAIQQYLFKFGAEKGSEYLGRFSKLMRQILEYSREEFIPLEDEIETLTNYLEVQKMRFEGQFSYSIQVDEDLAIDEAGVPPMFAQPVIENALEHGLFRSSDSENHIQISFEQVANEMIRLTITDTGTGFQSVNAKKEYESLSTVITQERLNILSQHTHKKATYQAENVLDHLGKVMGAKVEFQLPIRWI